MGTRLYTAKIVEVELERPLEPIAVERRYRDLVLLVRRRGRVLGEVAIPALETVSGEIQRAAIAARLAEAVWREQVADAFEQAALGPGALPALPAPRVSVIVCTRDRPDELRACLDSLLALRTGPAEIVVVDNAPADDRTARLCAGYPVRYVVEPVSGASRARNRGILESTGDLLAFTDDDCLVDPGWLDELERPFADPLLGAVTGYVAPFEIETRAQYLFELHGGFERHGGRLSLDAFATAPLAAASAAGASANAIFRRSVLAEVGLFAEDLGPGASPRTAPCEDKDLFYRLLAAGYRIEFDNGRLVRHRHRRDYRSLRRVLSDYGAGEAVLGLRWLLRRRELWALRLGAWWFLHHLLHDLRLIVSRDERRIPVGLVLAEAAGAFAAPWRLLRAALARRPEPLALPAPGTPAPPAPVVVRPEAPPLSVVVTSYDRCDQLAETLAHLGRQTYPPERFDVTVVLDGSTDGSAEMVRALDAPYPVRLLTQENRGLAATRNRGARESGNPVVVFCDDDIYPEPQFLAAHAHAHAAARDEHLVLGYYPPALRGNDLWGQMIRGWWEDHFRRKLEPNHQWTYIDYCGGNASFPRALFVRFDGFDERFRGRREDWELAIRLLQDGVRFAYHPEARGWHHLDTSLATAIRHARQEARDDVLIARLHPAATGQLPLAGVARSFGEDAFRRALFAYRHPEAGARLARGGPLLAGALEAWGLRGRWRAVTHALVGHAYLLGLAEVLPSPEALLDFVAPIWQEPASAVAVSLDAGRPESAAVGTGSLELSIAYRAAPIGRIVAMDFGGQWDWRELSSRALQAIDDPLRRALLRAELEELTAPSLEFVLEEAVGRVAHGR